MPVKPPTLTAPRVRKEHTLTSGQYARTQLTKLARSMLAWRERTNTSRRALAGNVGCHQQQIANIEKRQSAPSWGVYVGICREMGVEPLANFPTV